METMEGIEEKRNKANALQPGFLAVAQTDVGCVRSENQDRFFISSDRRILLVADGMGGHQGGSKAAAIVAEVFEEDANSKLPGYKSRSSVKKWVDRVIRAANTEVFLTSNSESRYSGMGTTAVALVFGDGFVHVAHAGDSRAYRLRDGKLESISKDHSVIQDLVDEGVVKESERRGHPRSHIITRHVGEFNVEPEHHAMKTKPGDIYLLCSDGLSDVLDDEEIAEIFSARISKNSEEDLDVIAISLVKAVKERGAPDNITVVISRVD